MLRVMAENCINHKTRAIKEREIDKGREKEKGTKLLQTKCTVQLVYLNCQMLLAFFEAIAVRMV